ncbi:MAG: hypothetical protein JNM40_22485 [Myxococcales bacterium]|nr:hypothetical protein [Myxococcales bacterium]
MSGFGVSLGRYIRGLSALAGLCLGILLSSGCSRSIGDGCANNTECSALGDRYCDTASPGGYCTVEGCDQLSCPDDALCVRFFSLQKGRASCDATRQVRSDCSGGSDCCKPGDLGCCKLGERCLCDEEGCTSGFCASEASERRYCMKPCDGNDDCRDGYQCVTTGASGAIAVTYRDSSGSIISEQARYCAPPK